MALQQKIDQLKKEIEGKSTDNSIKFDLLWNFLECIEQTPKEQIQAIASSTTKLFLSCLSLGNFGIPLRHALTEAILEFVKHDPEYSAALNTLKTYQQILQGKNASASTRAAAIYGIGVLCRGKSMQIASVLDETVALLCKNLKASEISVRISTLDALRQTVEGVGTSGNFIHVEVLKGIKNSFSDKSPEVRIAACHCLSALASFSNNFSYLEGKDGGIALCAKLLEDSHLTVRTVASTSLGKQLGIAISSKNSLSPKQPQKKSTTSWTLEFCLNQLATLFKGTSKRELRAGISQSYESFFRQMHSKTIEKNLDPIITSIFSLLPPPSNKVTDDNLHVRSCVEYILQTLINSLGELGQQAVVKIFSNLLKDKATLENETKILVILKELSYLLLSLGEGASIIEEPLGTVILPAFLNNPSSEIRLSAALSLRCLVTALPSQLASILQNSIATVRKGIEKTAESTQGKNTIGRHNYSEIEGNAYAIAALTASIPSTLLGVPNTVTDSVLEIAMFLLKNILTIECGWAIVGALMRLGPSFVEPRLGQFFALWKPILNCESGAPKAEPDVIYFTRSKAAALNSLALFISSCPSLLTSKVVQQIVSLLTEILNVVPSLPSSNSTSQGIVLLKLNLLKTFSALPPPSYANSFVSVLHLLTTELTEGTYSVSLSSVLNEDDSILGPWGEGHEAIIDKLLELPTREFNVASIWETSIEDSLLLQKPAGALIVDLASKLFANIYSLQGEKNRQQLLDHFNSQIKSATAVKKPHIQVNCVASLVRALKELTNRKSNIEHKSVLPTLVDFIRTFLSDQNVELRRGAGEALGFLARIEGDKFHSELMKSIIELIKKSKDPLTISGCAFSLGCIQRYVGGMRIGTHLPGVVSTLQDLLKEPTSFLHIWAIHSICLTAESAGPTFAPLVKPTLSIAYSLMLSDDYYSLEHYRSLGRVVHSIVHALGPELVPGSVIMHKCNAVNHELKRHWHPLIRLEAIHFQQSLILFAPQTMAVPETIQFLRTQFESPYLMVRSASVVCLRQLVGINVSKMNGLKLEEDLAMLLDQEKDTTLCNELKLLISTLLDMLAPVSLSPWLQLFRKIVLTTARSNRKAASGMTRQETDIEAKEDIEADSGMLQKSNEEEEEEDEFIPRWRTKVFAIECVRRLISVLAPYPQHFDITLARQAPNGSKDYLVFSLGELIRLAFSAASSDIETMRPVGVYTMKDIVEHFSKSIDPDYQGHLLLEQYQAQIASALRPAFNPEAPPSTTAAACFVLVSYVTSNILRESKVINKAVSLLTSTIDNLRALKYNAYSEKATTMVQLAILSSLAQLRLASISKTEQAEYLDANLQPYIKQLKQHWISLLRDYIVLTTQSKSTIRTYEAAFFTFSTVGEVLEYYNQAWALVLLACTSLVSTKFWDESSKDEFYLLLGISVTSLSGPHDASKTKLCLKSCRELLTSKYLTFAVFSYDLCQELANLLRSLIETGSVDIQLETVKVIHQMVSNCEADYFSKPGGDILLHHFLETVIFPIHHYIRPLHSATEEELKAIQVDDHTKALVIASFSSFGDFTKSFSSTLRLQYGPLLLHLLLRLIDLIRVNPEFHSLLEPILRSLKAVAQSDSSAEWEQILHSALFSLLQSSDSCPFQVLFVLLASLPYKTETPELHQRCIKLFNNILEGNNIENQVQFLIGLRTFTQAGVANPASPLHKVSMTYLKAVIPNTILLLQKISKQQQSGSTISDTESNLCSEVVKMLTLLHISLHDAQHQANIYSILIPSLIGLLRPSQPNALHDFVLKLLLKLATDTATFKPQIEALTDWEKQQLETSFRQNLVQAERTVTRTAVKTSKPLSLDISKFN